MGRFCHFQPALLNGLFSLGENKSHSSCQCSLFVKFVLLLLLLLFVVAFIFSMPFKVIAVVIQFMFLGKNIFWVLLRAHFKMSMT